MTRGTAALLLALVAASAVDLWARWPQPAPPAEALAAFAGDDAQEVTLTHGDAQVRLVRAATGWQVVAPYDAPADPDRVAAVLAGLGRGVPLGLAVDDAADPAYGFDGGAAVRVEVSGAAGPLARVVVGANADAGATFLRRADAPTVWRAVIGGRSRYDLPPAAWRDRRLLQFSPDALTGIAVARADGAYALGRSVGADGRPGPWAVVGDPAFAVDPIATASVVRALAGLRALDAVGEGVDTGLDAPLATVTLTLPDGPVALRLSKRDALGFAAVDGRVGAWRIPVAWVDALGGPLASWADRTLLAVDPAGVTGLSLDQPGLPRVVLARDPDWRATAPPGFAVDPRRIAFAVPLLAQLRAAAWTSPPPDAFADPARVVVGDGPGRTLEVGAAVPGRAPGEEAVYLRLASRPDRVTTWPLATWVAVQAAFGR